MLPNDRLIDPDIPGQSCLTKKQIQECVQALFRAECAASINPDEVIRKNLATELVEMLLSPEN